MRDVVRKEDLAGALGARRELGRDYEDEVLDAFMEKLERRVEERLRTAPRERHAPSMLALPLGSLGLAIPLTAIAGEQAGLAGVFFVCVAIVLVNVAYALRR